MDNQWVLSPIFPVIAKKVFDRDMVCHYNDDIRNKPLTERQEEFPHEVYRYHPQGG